MKHWIFAPLLAAVIVMADGGAARAATVLARSVIGAGGSPSSGTLRSNCTLGQAVIGRSQSGTMMAWHGFWHGGLMYTSDVVEGPFVQPDSPGRFDFGAPAPNPTNGSVEFALMLPKAASVRLSLVDVSGRLVALAVDRQIQAGPWHLKWDGRGDRGSPIPSGVYYARLEVDGRLAARRSVILTR